MIAMSANGRIIANNTYPNSSGNNSDYYRLTANELLAVSAVPEPGVYAMLALGLCAVGFAARRRKG